MGLLASEGLGFGLDHVDRLNPELPLYLLPFSQPKLLVSLTCASKLKFIENTAMNKLCLPFQGIMTNYSNTKSILP